MEHMCAITFALVLTCACASAAGVNACWRNSLEPKGIPCAELTLAQSGNALYRIVVPAKPTGPERKAAEDLALWLGSIAGARFSIVIEGPVDGTTSGEVISVGRTRMLEASVARSVRDLNDEGYGIAARGRTLFLWGGRTRGPVNAVYALLEEELGCGWYTRSAQPTLPRMPSLRIAPVARTYVPVLLIRDPFYWDAFDGTWSLRNRTNSPSAQVPEEWGGHMKYALFVHTFNTLVPPDRYFKDHPEYYALVKGVRGTSQLCLTNPDVLRITVENVKKALRDNPGSRVISVSQNDCGGHCECPNCKAIDDAEGTKAGTVLEFVNSVAEAMEDEFPHVTVSTLAYLERIEPPKTIRPRRNVIIRVCSDSHAWPYPFRILTQTDKFQRALRGWSGIGARISIWDYTVNYSHYSSPMPNWQVAEYAIRYYLNHNVMGVMLQGTYQGPGSTEGPMRSWVWAKQLWDPSLDTRDLTRDFVYGHYGEAAEPIWEYEDMLWNMWDTLHDSPVLADQHIRYSTDSAFLSKEFLAKSAEIFERAEKLAKDTETLRRVKLAKFPTLYVKLMQGPGAPDFGKSASEEGGVDKQEYREILDEFAEIANTEKIEYLAEGPADTQLKTDAWRKALDEVK